MYAGPDTLAKNSRPLSERVGQWATPAGPDFAKAARSATGLALPAQAALWQTPTVANTEGGQRSRSGRRRGELLLPGQAMARHSPPDPQTTPDGAARSNSGLTLNPHFVEWLMNWPPGWTMLADGPLPPDWPASTGCASSEMAWFRWRRRMRSVLLRAASPPTFPPQLDLFG